MKQAYKKKSFQTIPDGVWESSSPNEDKKSNPNDITTDLQGNGYPVMDGEPKPMPPTAEKI